jgi:uncharacterized membrane protein
MGWYEWLLFLHVLGALLLLGSLVFYWGLVLEQYRAERAGRVATLAGVSRPADIAVMAGSLMSVVFGTWLAIYVDGYEVWDGWIVAAFVLWAIATETGRRSAVEFSAARDRARALAPDAPSTFRADTRRGLALHVITTVAVLLLLADMFWKPGA